MLFRQATLEAIQRGEVDLAFRRWKRPSVKTGGRQRTAVGELEILSVDSITEAEITEADATRAGFPSREALLQDLRPEGDLNRVHFRLQGPDTRIALREQSDLTPAEANAIQSRLERLDRGTAGPWTRRVMAAIAAQPETRAADLAAGLGVEKDWLKPNIRKLKDLGLTESLEVGYRLSPRGTAFLNGTDPELRA